MSDLNQVVIIGRLVEKPILKYSANGIAVSNLRVANNTYSKNSENKTKPNYFTVVVFGKQAENCEKYLDKGRQIGVSGRLDWNSWETSDGQKRSTVRIIANMVQFIGGKKEFSSDNQEVTKEPMQEPSESPANETPSEGDTAPPETSNDFSSTFESPIDDPDDIPF